MNEAEIRKNVRKGYANIAKQSSSCCAPTISCCCNSSEAISKAIGYSEQEMPSVPDDANLGLGYGNPSALTSLKEGETVLDLGSGAGFDCFLAVDVVLRRDSIRLNRHLSPAGTNGDHDGLCFHVGRGDLHVISSRGQPFFLRNVILTVLNLCPRCDLRPTHRCKPN